MIAYLRAAQGNPSYLTQTLTLPSAQNYNTEETIRPAAPLALGKSYTYTELLSAMIKGSDNNAAEVLLKNVPDKNINDVYNSFGVSPVTDTSADVISPIEYMRFFRILYNATYLGKTSSRNALTMLSETNFKDGIVAGVPADTTVAHKFGERSIEATNVSTATIEKRELHDCGIVYYPGTPYGICIMTEGKDLTTLASVIAQVSSAVYSDVAKGLLSQ
jgi:beta-lactamase class A